MIPSFYIVIEPPPPPLTVCGSHCCNVPFQTSDCPDDGTVLATVRFCSFCTRSKLADPVTSPLRSVHAAEPATPANTRPSWPEAEGTELPEATIQVLVATQTLIFDPAAALVLKYISPTEQVAGITVPLFNGRVNTAPLKSTSLACSRKFTFVCAMTVTPQRSDTMNLFEAFLLHYIQMATSFDFANSSKENFIRT